MWKSFWATINYIFLFIAVAVLVLWQMLLPGYILTLDMVFVPQTGLFPAWLFQKIILLAIFFNLGYLSFRFLPLPKDSTVRLFSALIYTANPFVYSRFLAGHWTHLMAYSLLPVFIHFLFKFANNPSFKLSFMLFLSIFLISLFSLHFFVMVILIMIVWFSCNIINFIVKKKYSLFKLTIINLVFGGLVFILLGGYWLIPKLISAQSFENRFDIRHWQAFAATNHDKISTTLNTLSLNGFWGEGEPWSKQFAWPQDYLVFWVATIFIALLICVGLVSGYKNKKIRSTIIFFTILGIFSYVFSTGVGETIFKNFNLWMYENVFFWRGFRDSQKFSGLLAMSYAVLSGYGVSIVINFLNKKKKGLSHNFYILIFAIPIMMGFLIWGGFKNQIRPVWYPEVWNRAKAIIQTDNPNYKILFLPWHGYLSLAFNNNLLVASPAKSYFGEKAVVSKSVEIGQVYDQEVDFDYEYLDKAVSGDLFLSTEETIDYFIKKKIKYIVYFQDLVGVDNLKYEFLISPNLKTIINDKQLVMYEIKAY